MKPESVVINMVLRAVVGLALGTSIVMSCSAQSKAISQIAGVDDTRMGAYRALAQLSFQAFQKGDGAMAAELARILERVWDQGEWKNSSDGSYCKANRVVCQPIDRALDVFIGPIINYSKKAPDRAAVQAGYNDFLDNLKHADQ
ncbi:MAG TPA: hypothetical protein VGI45_26420 [Terracidiphilus sp.]|jgi:hypothetical protein